MRRPAVPAWLALALALAGRPCAAIYFRDSHSVARLVPAHELCQDVETEFWDQDLALVPNRSLHSRTSSAHHHPWHALGQEGSAQPQGETLAEALRRVYGRDVVVSELVQEASIGNLGDTARLRRVARKLVEGQPVKVVALGGSVTFGHGPNSRRNAYINQLFAWLREAFPGAEHELLNHAVPATTSAYTAPCVLDMVPADADLVLIEFTFNDFDRGARHLGDPVTTSFEGLLRKLLRLGSAPALVYLQYWPGRSVSYAFNETVEGAYNELLQYYGVMGLSLRGALAALHPGDGPRLDEIFTVDGMHPSCVGSRYLADMLISHLQDLAAAETLAHFLRHAGRRLAQAGPPVTQPPPAALRAPLQPGSEGGGQERCVVEPAAFRPLVRPLQGFVWGDEGRGKWGWLAWRPGDALELDAPVAGLRASLTVGLGFLHSYEHMGQASIECVAGCACRRREYSFIYDVNVKMSLPVWRVVEATLQPGAAVCTLRVSVLSRTLSGEHKVKLTSLMLTEAPGFVMPWTNCEACAA